MRTLLAETHARQLLTALEHGRPLQPIEGASRHELYASFVSPFPLIVPTP